MGEEFLKKRGKQFKHHSDEDYEQKLASSNLFSDRQHVFLESYPCVPNPNVGPLASNVGVMVYDVGTDDLAVRMGACDIGHIQGHDGIHLREAMRHDTRCGGMVSAYITRQSAISKRFEIRILPMDENCTNSDGCYC